MKNNSKPLNDHQVILLLNVLHHAPARNESDAANGRARFLREAQDLREPTLLPVSNSFLYSLKVWMRENIPTIQTIKENKMLMNISTLVLVIAMLFGGAATAVQAAERSLPGQAMYQLKIMAEDAQGVVAGPAGRVEQSVQRVETRIQEMLRLQEQDQAVPEAAFARLQSQLETTQRLMLKLNDEEMKEELVQARTRLMAQEQMLAELQKQGNEGAVLDRIRLMLQEQLQLFGDGSTPLEQIREQIRDREQDRDSWIDDNPPANGKGNGAGPENGTPKGTCTPVQDGTGPGPGPAAGTPNSETGEGGGSYGPGPGEPCATCTPVEDGTGPGPGPGAGTGEPCTTCTPVQDGTGPGPGPVEEPPVPGSGGGPGPGEPSATCTPAQDGTGPGPGPAAGETPTPGGGGFGGKP